MTDFLSENQKLIWSLSILNGAVVLSLLAGYLFEVRPLRRRDDRFAEIEVERSQTALWRFALAYLGLQALLLIIYFGLFEELTAKSYLAAVFLPSYLAAYSVFLFFRGAYYRQIRNVAIETGADILVDLNHRILNRILDWRLEVASLAGLTLCCLLYFERDLSGLFPSLLLLMIYASVRTRKYFVKLGFACWYKGLMYGNIIFQIVKLVVIGDEFLEVVAIQLETWDYALILVTTLAILWQLLRSLILLPSVRKSVGIALRRAVASSSLA